MSKKRVIKSPGRMCILGEHQDYFGLPVIAAAIDRYISVCINKRNDDQCSIFCDDIGDRQTFSLRDLPLNYRHSRDYSRSLINVLHREGKLFPCGFDISITGDIPIKGGLSSSSAFCVALGGALTYKEGHLISPQELAALGFRAEVSEFKEYGGMMDHISSAFGGVMHIDFGMEQPKITKLRKLLSGFFIIDSREPKETAITGLAAIKGGVYEALEFIRKTHPDSNLKNLQVEKIINMHGVPHKKLIVGTIMTRDITRRGFDLLNQEKVDSSLFGNLIDQQHEVLRDYLELSTPKIERIITAAKTAGALGCKIIGSGGGGCVLVYAPNHEKDIVRLAKKEGGVPMRIKISRGTFIS